MNTAILWDIENVTPPKGTNYVQIIIDELSAKNKISYAMAFGDWNKSSIKNVAEELAANSFELIHVPQSRKDSSDMSMVAHGVELIFQYPHIEKFVLITGDADFRPLLLSLRKYGKESLIICDVTRNASEDLLKMADDFWDYRDIIEQDDDGDDDNDTKNMTRKQAFELLEDAIDQLQSENKKCHLGVVKIRMKLLDSSFNEKLLGYSSFKRFITDATKHANVDFLEENDDVVLLRENAKVSLPTVFSDLLALLKGKDWTSTTELGQKFNCRNYGYTTLKRLALDAEKRGLVQLKTQGVLLYLKISK